MSQKKETVLLFLIVLAAISILYQFREIAFIGDYLSTFTAILLIYPAILHASLRRMTIGFFETRLADVPRSLWWFVATSLVIFPPFLLFNHLYQTILFNTHLNLSHLSLGLETIAIQVLLVAFPEEFFFRGYLQTIIARHFPKKFHLFWIQALAVGWTVPITSLLFAASHSFITFRWWHFSIFFPSLVFGWLRERTNGLIAPILFHAVSNLLVGLIALAYQ